MCKAHLPSRTSIGLPGSARKYALQNFSEVCQSVDVCQTECAARNVSSCAARGTSFILLEPFWWPCSSLTVAYPICNYLQLEKRNRFGDLVDKSTPTVAMLFPASHNCCRANATNTPLYLRCSSYFLIGIQANPI